MRKRGWSTLIVLVVLLPSLWLVGVRVWARHRLHVADRRWAEASEPIDVLLARHPPTAENAAARRLVELSSSLGIQRPVMGVKGEPPAPALNAVFLAHALESGRAGDAEASRTALEASWRLQQSLRERPELISQLLVAIGAGMQHGVLRRLPSPPRQWRERLLADYRKPMLRTFQLDAWTFTSQLRGKGLQDLGLSQNEPPPRSGLLGWPRLVMSPYVELMSADYSNRLRVAAELVSRTPAASMRGPTTPVWRPPSPAGTPSVPSSRRPQPDSG